MGGRIASAVGVGLCIHNTTMVLANHHRKLR